MSRFHWLAVAIVLALPACGAASYNEGDNDDQPPVNECSELTPEDRPDDCEE